MSAIAATELKPAEQLRAKTSARMTDLLELPAIRKHVRPFSPEEYHRLGEMPVELLRGTVIQKMSKSPLHRFVADELRDMIAAQVGPKFTVFHEGPITTDDSEPEPDVSVVRGERASFRKMHPLTAELVIEVAVSSIEIDRVKASIYAEAGVREYWIVCPQEKRVEIFREPREDGYAQTETVSNPTVIESSALPGVRVDFGTLFA